MKKKKKKKTKTPIKTQSNKTHETKPNKTRFVIVTSKQKQNEVNKKKI